MSRAKPVGKKSPYLIHCSDDLGDLQFGTCGQSTYLTEAEYEAQLSDGDKGWRCPNCRCYPCEWDDANFEKHQINEVIG